jgi:hypothetical protein
VLDEHVVMTTSINSPNHRAALALVGMHLFLGPSAPGIQINALPTLGEFVSRRIKGEWRCRLLGKPARCATDALRLGDEQSLHQAVTDALIDRIGTAQRGVVLGSGARRRTEANAARSCSAASPVNQVFVRRAMERNSQELLHT